MPSHAGPIAVVSAYAPRAAYASTDRSAGALHPSYVLCQLLGWGGWAFVYSMVAARSAEVQLSHVLFSYGIYTATGILTSHLLRVVMLRNGWLSLPLRASVPRLLGGIALCVGTMNAGLYFINIRLLRLFDPGQYTVPMLVIIAINTAVLYGFWMAIYVSVYVSRRRRQSEVATLRLELALRDAQYRSLAAQVNPHFLFNSLNSLRALILVDPEKAILATTNLAGVLRYSLAAEATSEGERTVPLRDELEAVDDYLALERIRFDDRLRITRSISGEALAATLPRMMLQHLIENAIKHGIAPHAGGGELHIGASVQGGSLQVSVRNTGHLVVSREGTGTGLANTRQRLALLYGTSTGAACNVVEDSGSVVATLTVPSQTNSNTTPYEAQYARASGR